MQINRKELSPISTPPTPRILKAALTGIAWQWKLTQSWLSPRDMSHFQSSLYFFKPPPHSILSLCPFSVNWPKIAVTHHNFTHCGEWQATKHNHHHSPHDSSLFITGFRRVICDSGGGGQQRPVRSQWKIKSKLHGYLTPPHTTINNIIVLISIAGGGWWW